MTSTITMTAEGEPAHRGDQQMVGVQGQTADAMVRIRGAHRHYGPVHALDGIDLDVSRGEFLVLLGPSGSGKSTLLRSVAGIETLGSGTIELDGRMVSGPRGNLPPEQRNLGMVFQDYALWPHMTVAQNVLFPLRQRRSPAKDRDFRVAEILNRVGLSDLAGRYPNELSGGQQQRVALARALVSKPSLVLFDEPLSNLDADLRERLRLEIAELTREQGTTAIYITHDQHEAFALADRVGVLDAGRLVQCGIPEEIYRNPASSFVARFTGVAGTLDGRVARLLGDGRCEIELADHSVIIARCAPGLGDRSRCEVQVRPSASRIQEPEPGDSHIRNRLAGSVTDTAYRGAFYDHVLRGPWGVLSGVANPRPLPRGASCTLELSAEDMMCFPIPAPVHPARP